MRLVKESRDRRYVYGIFTEFVSRITAIPLVGLNEGYVIPVLARDLLGRNNLWVRYHGLHQYSNNWGEQVNSGATTATL